MRHGTVGFVSVLVTGLASLPAFAAMQASAPPHAWWGVQQGAWIGTIGGMAIGLLGGVIGTLCSLGKGGRLVMGLTRGLFVLGLICLAAGVIALARSQPYAVYYPLLLVGVVTAGVTGFLQSTVRRRFAEIEMRKMDSMDAS
jgi:hypothetical protein